MREKIVVARVDSGAGESGPPGDTRTGIVRLSIVVSEVLAGPKGDLTSDGKASDLRDRPIDMYFLVLHFSGYSPPSNNDGDLVGPVDGPLTDADIIKLYVGKEFIFSIDNPSAAHPSAEMWPLSAKVWVIKTIHEPFRKCPAPRVQ
jgi:hypothetical protein